MDAPACRSDIISTISPVQMSQFVPANHLIKTWETSLLSEINDYNVLGRSSSIGVGGGTVIADSVVAHDCRCNLLSVSADSRLCPSPSTRIGVVIYL